MILISPSEPVELRQALKATNSPLCEKLGADVLAPTIKGLVGVQRKEVLDFIASLKMVDWRGSCHCWLMALRCRFYC